MGMEPAELGLERAGTERVQPIDCELVCATWGVDLDPAVADHGHAVGRLDRESGHGASPDHSPKKGLFVLQREVDVAR